MLTATPFDFFVLILGAIVVRDAFWLLVGFFINNDTEEVPNGRDKDHDSDHS